MIIVPPVEISTLVSSNIDDTTYVYPVAAAGWIAIVTPPAVGTQFQVHDQIFTIVASGTSTGQVLQGNSDIDQATKISEAINRDLSGVITSFSDRWTVFISAATPGVWGNSIVLSETSDLLSTSGSTLTGGIDEVAGTTPWENDRTYALGAQVVQPDTHTLYESLVADNYDNAVDDSTKWLNLGKTNRWKMFDTSSTSKTQNPDSIEAIFAPGGVNALALLGCNATSINITLRDPSIGIVYNRTVYPPNLNDYTLVLTDIPDFASANVEITISNTGDTAACGMVIVGTQISLGTTLYNPRVTMLDYSTKDVDEWGGYSVVERAFSRQLDVECLIAMSYHAYVRRILAQYRATPALYIADSDYSILSVYGFYKDFTMSLDSPNWAKMSISIEGLI